jgi:endo-1,4-beta-xylanase
MVRPAAPALLSLAASRRGLLRDALRFATGAAVLGSPLALLLDDAEAQTPRGAAIPFGAAVRSGPLAIEPDYRKALVDHCQIVVAEHELKWDWLRGDRASFNFDGADQVNAFARENRMSQRGHTLAWYLANPDWLDTMATRAEAERELRGHIRMVMSRYRRVIGSWDVVNEAIPNEPLSVNDLRASIWSKRLGFDYIAIAFRAARDTDPTAELVINEYDIEFEGPRYDARRKAFLTLLRTMRERGVPVSAVGLQGHLPLGRRIDKAATTKLVRDITALGLPVFVSELDVMDQEGPGEPEFRDMAVAATAYEFLDAVTAGARPSSIITWGISDRHTWVPMWWARADGRANRPLPFDAQMRPKPLKRVIDFFCAGGGGTG